MEGSRSKLFCRRFRVWKLRHGEPCCEHLFLLHCEHGHAAANCRLLYSSGEASPHQCLCLCLSLPLAATPLPNGRRTLSYGVSRRRGSTRELGRVPRPWKPSARRSPRIVRSILSTKGCKSASTQQQKPQMNSKEAACSGWRNNKSASSPTPGEHVPIRAPRRDVELPGQNAPLQVRRTGLGLGNGGGGGGGGRGGGAF